MTDTVAADPGLGASFQGTTIAPQHRDYDAARAIYNGSIDRRPALIVRPHGAADVADAVRYANEQGLRLSVRCGGHGIAGTSLAEDGMLLDLSPLKGVHVDRARGTAVAQGGALWGEYDRDAALHGVATPGGRVTTTGVGGFCLGGGYGWLSTLYGLTCDNLVAADVVTADGRLVHASEVENPDLLWGLRGAGANFGVVTSYELRVHEIPPLMLGGMVVVPNDDEAADIVRAYRAYVEQAPEQLVSALATILAPPAPFVPPEAQGHPAIAVVVTYAGPVEEGEKVLAPLREFGPPVIDLVEPMPYVAVQQLIEPGNPEGMQNYWTADFYDTLPDDAVDVLVEHATQPVSPLTQVIVVPGGGAIARVPEDAMAFGQRHSQWIAATAWAMCRR